MQDTYEGQLEVDASRGVIYFHSVTKGTMLRICRLPKEQLERLKEPNGSLDITHMIGSSSTSDESGTTKQ